MIRNDPSQMIRNFMPLSEAEQASGIPRATLRRWCESGEIVARGWEARQSQKGSRMIWQIRPGAPEALTEETGVSDKRIESIIADWRAAQASGHLTGRHISAKALTANEYGLRKLWELLGAPPSVASVTAEGLRLALSRVEVDTIARNCHYSIREKLFNGTRSFLLYLESRGLASPAERLQTRALKPRRIFEAVRPAPEMAQVIEVLGDLSQPAAGRVAYDRALTQTAIAICALAGLRRAELLALDLADADLTRGVITVQDGKGHKRRKVGITPALKKQIAYWLATRAASRSPRLLIMASGAPLSETSLSSRLKRLEAKTGVTLNPHALRRAFITYNLGRGVPLVVVQRLAGHADAKTTQIYDRTTDDAAMDWLRGR